MLTNFVSKYINDRNNFSLKDNTENPGNESGEYVFGLGASAPTSADAMSGMKSTRLSRYQHSRQSQDEVDGASPYLSAKYGQTLRHDETLS